MVTWPRQCQRSGVSVARIREIIIGSGCSVAIEDPGGDDWWYDTDGVCGNLTVDAKIIRDGAERLQGFCVGVCKESKLGN